MGELLCAIEEDREPSNCARESSFACDGICCGSLTHQGKESQIRCGAEAAKLILCQQLLPDSGSRDLNYVLWHYAARSCGPLHFFRIVDRNVPKPLAIA